MADFLTIPEIVAAARARLAPPVWDFTAGGADTEATLHRNRQALDEIRFRPRILRDVHQRHLGTTFLGRELALPVMLAPVGSIARYDPGGGLTAARAAQRAGSALWVSTMATPSLEEIAAADGPLFFQLYVRGDRDWITALVRRLERAGYAGLCVTADSAEYGRRNRDLENRFMAREKANKPNCPPPERHEFQAMFNWSDIAWLRETTRLPIIIKGVMTPEDARLAVDHGAAAIYVSNHGGRQLDFAPSTIEVLAGIVDAVAGRAEVVVDSGFLRGTDVVKALALGARAVLIGKLQCYGLAAAGQAGLEQALALLAEEMSIAMALLGVTRPAELGRQYLTGPAWAAP